MFSPSATPQLKAPPVPRVCSPSQIESRSSVTSKHQHHTTPCRQRTPQTYTKTRRQLKSGVQLQGKGKPSLPPNGHLIKNSSTPWGRVPNLNQPPSDKSPPGWGKPKHLTPFTSHLSLTSRLSPLSHLSPPPYHLNNAALPTIMRHDMFLKQDGSRVCIRER